MMVTSRNVRPRAVGVSGAIAIGVMVIRTAVLAENSTAATQATFTKDVAPILQRACQNCHRTGSMAPMSLLTYEDARPWARSIKQKVAGREMPPWFIDRHIGLEQFK